MRTVLRADRAVLPRETGDEAPQVRRFGTPKAAAPLVERPAAVLIDGERIASVLRRDAVIDPPPDAEITLGPDQVLLPGLVDSHVHVNEPGRTEWEGFASATRAAAAGGVTTLIDMPLNSIPPTTTVANLKVKRKAADGQCLVDVGFWGGAVPGNLADLATLHRDGVFGFKCFLLPSGVDEFPPLSRSELADALRVIAELDALLIVHAEDPELVGEARGRRYAEFVASRPPAAEDTAIATLLQLAAEAGARAHVLHLSSASALPLIAEAKAAGLPVTAETCPHYLALSAEEVPDGDTRFKCCPPVRDEANRDALWQGLADGTIDAVVSDHSPSTPDLKLLDPADPRCGDFGAAWGGIASLQLGLPVVWTAARARGHDLAEVVGWMSAGPARLTGLTSSKGGIIPGADADLVVFAPDEPVTVDPGRLHHRNPITPYAGRTLTGVVRATWLRGQPVRPDDPAAEPRGHLLIRGAR